MKLLGVSTTYHVTHTQNKHTMIKSKQNNNQYKNTIGTLTYSKHLR